MGVCVGVDVSKETLDWAAGAEGAVRRHANTPAGVRQLVAALRKLEMQTIVIESTGGMSAR